MSATPQEESALSLLSLSMAAANATPIPISRDTEATASSLNSMEHHPNSSLASSSVGASVGGRSTSIGPAVHNGLKHRRLSSSTQMKKRISDARDAATRPSPVGLQTAAAALTALANLSLTSNSSQRAPASTAVSLASASASLSVPRSSQNTPSMQHAGTSRLVSLDDDFMVSPQRTSHEHAGSGPEQNNNQDAQNNGNTSGTVTKNGKKRGTIFTCESCSKVYRHPSCLIKHRWEHSPHWREASKFLLSKHQQVQLMEAAAILSHMSPTVSGGSSLPDDRSLWPSYLSDGLLPPPLTAAEPSPESNSVSRPPLRAPFPAPYALRPASSSVPATSVMSSSRPTSTGPRLHDYAIPGAGGVTHFRPGVLGVPVGSAGTAEAISSARTMSPYSHEGFPSSLASVHGGSIGDDSESWGSPVLVQREESFSISSSTLPVAQPSSLAQSHTGTGAWSLPRSSFVSTSASSRSRSISVPRSDESEFVDIDTDVGDVYSQSYSFTSRGRTSIARYGVDDDRLSNVGFSVKEEEEEAEWDGMEMEMEL
ncbi:hypothetical protein EW146_g2984 [Bondarzewia mesenterica]|uniref:C2H2-type domain-containing protein n=1 Tax=Bondarzewia mesenterica TaxID=1095465 RepID=A0A4S4M193_9AGAM|nr:hypothetical protein EW146_g2984 [Bondarzewia mesenterica]